MYYTESGEIQIGRITAPLGTRPTFSLLISCQTKFAKFTRGIMRGEGVQSRILSLNFLSDKLNNPNERRNELWETRQKSNLEAD